ncbi:MAG: type II CAAX endopeptidase family protein, partial [Desulfobacteraceae bacterium]
MSLLKFTADLTHILILSLISSTFLSIFFISLSYAVPPLQDTLFLGVALSILSNIVFIFFIVYFIKVKGNGNVLKYLHIEKTRNIVLESIVIPVIGGLLFAVMGFIITSSFFSSVSSTSPMSDALLQGTTAGKAVFILFAIIVAPLLEEIIFRGYFFTAISRIKGKHFAIAFVATLFAFLHVDQNWGDFIAVVLIFLFGLYLTLLRYFTKSLIPSIVSHYVYNIAIILLPTIYLSIYNPSYLEFMNKQDSIRFEEQEMLLLKSIEDKPEFSDAYNAL